MASLGGVSSSNTLSSLMNSANMISGLASGLDTEGMIENLVKSYQAKINQLNQKVTKVEWKQDAYRSIISKMVSLADKYTSYTSSTNLMSRTFFNNAVTVSSLGKYADKVSASGKTSSDISLNAVHQIATAAKFRTASNMSYGDGKSIEASEGLDLNGQTKLGVLSGSLTLTYGSQKVSISFDQVSDVEAMKEIRAKLAKEQKVDENDVSSTDVLAELINKKLSGQTINLSGGKTAEATDRIEVEVEDGKISFRDKSSAGNSVFVSGASGNVGVMLGISGELKNEDKNKPRSIYAPGSLEYFEDNSSYLAGRTMNLNLDGVTKTINLPKIYSKTVDVLDSEGKPVVGEDGEIKKETKQYLLNAKGEELDYNADNYATVLNEAVQKAFGGKVEVTNTAKDGTLKLRFAMKEEGSSLAVNTDVGDALGIGRTATSYLSTSKTLGDLMGDKLDGLTPAVDKDGNNLLDKDGNQMYAFEINGVTVGNYSKNTKLSDLMNDINNSDAGVKITYSQTTKNFLIEAKETGADSKVELGNGLAKAMFGSMTVDTSQRSRDYLGLKQGEVEGHTLSISVDGQTDPIEYTFSGDNPTLSQMLGAINGKLKESGVDAKASFDNTGALVLTDSKGNRVDYKANDEIAAKLKTSKLDNYNVSDAAGYTKGQDAIFNVTVNGETMQMTRSSNTVNIDGMSITMKDTFNTKVDEDGNPILFDENGNQVEEGGKYAVENTKESVTFKSSTDSDRIIDVIKELVNDYNTVMAEIKSAYSTMPYQSSGGTYGGYEPLTEEDMEGMSESAIARYEEKAKQGILFGDRTLSTLYDKLNQVFSFNNKADVDTLKDMGITVSYSISGGTQAVTIDEGKLRAMLDSDPDRVADLFTKTDGVMDRMKTQLDNYAKTTGEPKGILIQQAGSPLSSLSLLNNFWQQEIDGYTTQIEKWQTKLESQVERYTSQFARLEQLIAQMNNQSSTLSGLMGGF